MWKCLLHRILLCGLFVVKVSYLPVKERFFPCLPYIFKEQDNLSPVCICICVVVVVFGGGGVVSVVGSIY